MLGLQRGLEVGVFQWLPILCPIIPKPVYQWLGTPSLSLIPALTLVKKLTFSLSFLPLSFPLSLFSLAILPWMWTPTTLGIVPISLICIPRNLGTFGPLIPPPLHCLVGVTGLLRPLLPVGLGASGLDTLDGFGELLRVFPSAGPGCYEGGGREGETFVSPLLATPSLESS